MKSLKQPIEIDFLEFFKTGKFDYLKLGQTKEWIRNNFPDPDNEEFEHDIWQYGNIELHFYQSKLFLIFSDYISELEGGKSLKLNKWILGIPKLPTLGYVLEKLNEEWINYSVMHDKSAIYVDLITSKVRLYFINYEEERISPNHYRLNAIGLMKMLWVENENKFSK